MKIAITGGIGTGKSTVIKLLQQHLRDYLFFSVDEVVATVYDAPEVLSFLEVIGVKNKAEMSDVVFANPHIKKQLEAITNPIILRALEGWLTLENIIVEFPLLYRDDLSDFVEKFDAVVGVATRNYRTRIDRVIKRSGFPEDKILRIMDTQPSDRVVNGRANYVIENDGSLAELEQSVENLVVNELQLRPPSATIKAQSDKILSSLKIRDPIKVGLVSSSFDPITRGHLYVIKKALDLVDQVRIVVAKNVKKKSYFDETEKSEMIKESILEVLGPEAMTRIRIDFLPDHELLITHARKSNAKFIFRGIRNNTDLEYEHSINLAQHLIDDSIETIYILPPRKATEISSSLVKALYPFPDARIAVEEYVTQAVLKVMDRKLFCP